MNRARNHGAKGSRYPVEVTDEHGHTTIAALLPPGQPTRRADPGFSRYDRLDPKPARKAAPRSGYRNTDLDGAAALAYALARLEAKVRAEW